MSTEGTPDAEGVAIIGMSGRFPGAKNIDEFWRNLCDGVESITFFTDQELEALKVSPAQLNAPNFVRAAPLLSGIDLFDAHFFGYTPTEAEVIDPQQRFFLECAWEALEHAGYDSETYPGWVGVFGGLGLNSYMLNNLSWNDNIRAVVDTGNTLYLTTANNGDYLTTRVSYKLNLKGPSVVVQTACSTSLVATHLACQSLLNYQCDMALAGGVAIPAVMKGYHYHEGGILSPDGHCRTFDARARGTIFGSGVGIVVLKRLSDALAEGDTIYAVIRGSAINNDGSLKVGFTAPGVEGQASVIMMAQGVAGVDPETISYIEAHGTATPVGDPIEVGALTKVFRDSTQKKQFCAIGSVKTNIGHADTAAGVAGLIKTVLALKHKQIPPSLHYEQPNPKIDFANSPFYVNTTLSEWKAGPTPRRAGVNSFGVGGTNAHIVLEEAPPVAPSGPSRPWQLLLLSARTDAALEAMTDNLVAHLEQHPDLKLADVAHTLQVGRRAFSQRRMLVCRDLEDAVGALEARDPNRVLTLPRGKRDRPVVFMFSGQGAQYPNMGRELYEAEPVFREHVDQCAELLRPHLGLDVRDLLYPNDSRMEDGRSKIDPPSSILHPPSSILDLDQTQYAQPALFVIEYALARLWMEWGVQPEAMIGHSIGEYVAACLAGVFSLEDALMLVAARGRLMQQMPPGAMLAVSLPEQRVLPLLGDQLALAAINGPSRCVVAGPTEAVEALERRLTERGVDCRRLHTSHAFHSSMMEPILEPFTRQVQRVQLEAPAIPYISNVTGTWIADADATDPRYWARHLRQAVRFADGLRELAHEPDRILLEVGPGKTLSTFARQLPGRPAGQLVLASLRHPQDQQPDVALVLNTLGQLWLANVRIDWAGFYAHERRQRLPLPTYPFERQRYWVDPTPLGDRAGARASAAFKKTDIADWFYIPSWKRSVAPIWEPAEQPSCWLVFADEAGLGAQLVQRLEQAGQDVVAVLAGEQFDKRDERTYVLDPRRPEDYDRLVGELGASHAAPWTIAHLWSLNASERPLPDSERAVDLSFYSLLFLAQALGKQDVSRAFYIGVVSNSMQRVAREAVRCPENATLLGPCKVIPQEYPNISCQSIDLVLPEPGTLEREDLLDQLLAELAGRSDDRVIAYRDYDRWVQTYEPVRLGEALDGRTRLREGGVYLITGGLGGIGLVLAGELARSAHARLVLTGRSAFPERGAWDGWLATHGDQDSVSMKIHKLQELESYGAEVLVVRADVIDERQMRAAVARTCEQFGTIHGVIHSAGIAGGGMIQLKTSEQAARVLAPKVTALRVLEAALGDIQLDFMVLCSSITSVTGGVGQVDYCAANAFMDAYAHSHSSRRGTHTVSINWDAWQEVGMAVDTAAAYSRQEGPLGIYYQEIGHPLVEKRIRETPAQEVYLTEFHGASHWVLSEHKIMGVPAIPGTAYLEMARAAFESRAQGEPVEIREAFFLTPLMVAGDERREVNIILDGDGDLVSFRVVSRPAPLDGEEPAWQEHANGRIGRLAAEPPRQHRIEDILAKGGWQEVIVTEEDIKKVEQDFNKTERVVYWGPRWMSLRRAYVGEGEGLAVLELPEEFSGDLAQFALHPALLDVATAFGNGLVRESGSFLPLSYRGLKVLAPLPQKVYSHITYKRDDTLAKKETISFEITIMDEQGRELVAIEDFTMRRIDDSMGRLRASAGGEHQQEIPHEGDDAELPRELTAEAGAAPAAAPARTGLTVTGILSREGVEAFKRILARNRLPQVVVSTKDLHAVIERANTAERAGLIAAIDKVQPARPVYPRPNMAIAYVAPRSDLERRLAEIWQQVLGIEQVGVHDSFFDLGGDSVLAIHVISRAGATGIQLTPPQLFQFPTVAQLAAAVSPDQIADQGEADGAWPLSPFQQRFFELPLAAPGAQSQALLLEVPPVLDITLLEQAAQHLLAHHDALRLRFTLEGDGWRLRPAQHDEHPIVARVDHSGLPAAERAAALDAYIAAARAAFDLAAGPLVQIALVDYGPDSTGRLLLLAHHLLVDAASWGVLLGDLWTAYEQLGRGDAVALPPGTASFKQWGERLSALARSDALREELPYWLAELGASVVALPTDDRDDDAALAAAPADVVALDLSADETLGLLEVAPRAYRMRVEEVLLTALVDALARWLGGGALLMDLEGSGREAVFDDLDLSRTVGCCTTFCPLRLDLDAPDQPEEALKAVKELLRAVPRQGIGYGLLRYLSRDAAIAAQLAALPQAEVSFGYLGQSDRMLPEGGPFRLAAEWTGPVDSPRGAGPYLLDIKARVVEGRLQVDWTYSEYTHRRATIERLADDFMASLQELIAHCRSREQVSLSTSDFPEAGLNQEELDKFLTGIRRPSR